MLNQDLNAGKFRYMPLSAEQDSRKWALANDECPLEVFGESKMCYDCPDGCPLVTPLDIKNADCLC